MKVVLNPITQPLYRCIIPEFTTYYFLPMKYVFVLFVVLFVSSSHPCNMSRENWWLGSYNDENWYLIVCQLDMHCHSYSSFFSFHKRVFISGYISSKKTGVLKRQSITLWSCICSIKSRLHLYVHDIRIKKNGKSCWVCIIS